MNPLFNTFYTRTKYLLFRSLYTTTHLAVFCLFGKKWDRAVPPHRRSCIIICGAECGNPSARERIEVFLAWLNKNHADKNPVIFSKKVQKELPGTGVFPRQIPWEWQTRARLIHPVMKLIYPKAPFFQENKIREIAVNSCAIYDLGLHQLSSLRDTGWTANVLANIVFARRYAIPYIMAPQYFGPFRYRPRVLDLIYRAMIKKIIPYATLIGAIDESSHSFISAITDKTFLQADLLLFLELQRNIPMFLDDSAQNFL